MEGVGGWVGNTDTSTRLQLQLLFPPEVPMALSSIPSSINSADDCSALPSLLDGAEHLLLCAMAVPSLWPLGTMVWPAAFVARNQHRGV
jgi:hypothetical protein